MVDMTPLFSQEIRPLLSIDSLIVLGMLTSETLDVCFFFFGLSTYLEDDLDRCLRCTEAPAVVLVRPDSLVVPNTRPHC